MENSKVEEIKLPEGCFFGNCVDCRQADWSDTDKNGRVYCVGGYGGYNYPRDRNGCFYYVEK